MTWELVESMRQIDLFGILTLDQAALGVVLGALVRWVFDLEIGLGTAAAVGVLGMALEPGMAELLGAVGPSVVAVNALFAAAGVLVASGILQTFQR